MSEYCTSHEPHTSTYVASLVIVTSVLAAPWYLSAGHSTGAMKGGQSGHLPQAYYNPPTNLSPPSYAIGYFIKGYAEDVDRRFVEVVSNFYTKLLANQETLGPEFARVLYDNFWDLLEE